jgi:hypothetical protein
MFACPHCGKTIDVGPAPKVPWWQYDSGAPNVSLGCGTLILIAIIVAIFSGDSKDEIREALRREIRPLEKKIDALDAKLNAIPAVPQAEKEN